MVYFYVIEVQTELDFGRQQGILRVEAMTWVLLYPLCFTRHMFELQCVAVCCSMLQSVAGCCSVLQCVAVWHH